MTICPRCGKKTDGPHTCTPKAVWPTWPFTKFEPAEMARLIADIKRQKLAAIPEALF